MQARAIITTAPWPLAVTARAMVSAAAVMILPLPAGAASPSWQGVWAGQIGTLPVRACFRREDWGGGGTSRAFYYYLSQGKIIPLAQRGDSRLWVEHGERNKDATEPEWTFDSVSASALAGVWRKAGKALPFRLTRAGGTDVETTCGSDAFNLARVKPVRITAKPAVKDGVRYTRLFYNPGPQFSIAVETFVLPESRPGARAVNVALRKTLPALVGTNDDLECEFSGLDGGGGGGYLERTVAPAMITRLWLSTEVSEDSYCGGAHPNSETTHVVYDLTTGKAVDPLDWFAAVAIKQERDHEYTYKRLTPAFRKFLLAQKTVPDAECRSSLEDAEFWDAGLARDGLTLTPQLSHAEAPCENPVILAYARLAPWLNPAGKTAVASVVADIGKR